MAMEERAFSQAEMELFQAKYEVFQKSQAEVEEIVTFLKKQHSVEGDGWQIGQVGFFRMTPDAPDNGTSNIVVPNANDEGKTKKQT